MTAEALRIKPLEDLIEKNKDKTVLLEREVKGLLKAMGVAVPRGVFVGMDEAGAPSSLPALTYPLVAKVSSAKITSKTDVHGVRTGINNGTELALAIKELRLIADAEGVLVEEMAPQGVEVIVGGIIDRQFGPVMMFGLGGIFVELFKDVSFGLAPLSEKDAQRLIGEVKGRRLLEGFRGRAPVDIDALSAVVVKASELMATGLIEEIDLNPVAVYPKGAMVLDAKISLRRR